MINKKLKILVIDDDDVDKLAVQRALKSSGYNVDMVSAYDVETGIAAVKNDHFDCIFLDYSLPGASGFDFLENYKDIKGSSPIIMITSLGDEQLAVEAMKKGACDYIPKSLITPEGISQSLRYALRLNEVNQNTNRIEKALIESERKLETVISNSPIILFSIDRQGIFTLFKGNSTKVLNISTSEVIGKSIYDIEENLPVKLNDYLAACLGKEHCFTSKVNERHFEIHFIPEKGITGNLIEMTGVITDITVMKQTEEDLLKTLIITEESAKVKEQFMANMSHEIRTPVHGIMSLADILSKTSLNTEQTTYLTAVKRSADNLLVIINDILDLSKIESGKMTFETTPFIVKEVVQLSIELFRHKAAEKKLDFQLCLHEQVSEILKGDPVRLSQIINNLLSNAIKFTETGFVKIEIKPIENNEKSCVLNFKISDSGIGIQAKKLSTIFDTFTQASNDTTRKYGGTGLGLSIVKSLVEMQGGFITVESELNKGTTFIANIPFTLPDKNELTNSSQIIKEPASLFPSKLKILVVEDNEINQMIINKLLKDWGVDIANATNGIEAIDMLKKDNYDIVLMDIEMPEMNGYEATVQIRKTLPAPKNNIPILAMTAHASHKEKEKCFTSGMNDYLSKPFDPAIVRKKIMELTTVANYDVEIPTDGVFHIEKEKEETEVSQGRLTNLNFLKEMSDENDSFIKDFITLFLQNAPESIQALQQHLKKEEWEQMRQVAHKIKPSFNYLGLKNLHQAAASIEEYTKQETKHHEIPGLIDLIVKTTKVAFKELESDIKLLTV